MTRVSNRIKSINASSQSGLVRIIHGSMPRPLVKLSQCPQWLIYLDLVLGAMPGSTAASLSSPKQIVASAGNIRMVPAGEHPPPGPDWNYVALGEITREVVLRRTQNMSSYPIPGRRDVQTTNTTHRSSQVYSKRRVRPLQLFFPVESAVYRRGRIQKYSSATR